MPITNPQFENHVFLDETRGDDFYPEPLVDRGALILVRLCERIEERQPADLAALYVLTHAATEEFNRLEQDFDAADSEIETMARDAVSMDFWFIARAYGFEDADIEELVAPREW
ncbi:DUF5713 family protein [Yinghuangia seranimata]|uniref:DUF5713 family protein n=1 Tax=Yinghuangia seranimata TaxID=408067 RepID=UPI00248CDD4A|nr:DUF5713 family protein [Yinghuangia seranimata]MDI2132116.1 DUF5713 family protein [Yinghuangia seranimata]